MDAYAGPVYFMLHDVRSQDRARELVAVSHAALYGELEPLKRVVPEADLICPRTLRHPSDGKQPDNRSNQQQWRIVALSGGYDQLADQVRGMALRYPRWHRGASVPLR
ncbi:hypothetical protein SRO_3506 [Streptomyces rochei]|nr:hypothetical protein SRO_3506 [Streptomyces rochei]